MTPRELAKLFWSPLHDWGLGEDGMTIEEALEVMKIMNGADDGCSICAENLLKEFQDAQPRIKMEWKGNGPFLEAFAELSASSETQGTVSWRAEE